MAGEQVTAIVAYEVAAEDEDKFLPAWERANDYLKQQDGHVSTTLHKAVSANPHFRFVNIGCWESDEAFRNATQSVGFRDASGSLEAYPLHAAVYEVVRE